MNTMRTLAVSYEQQRGFPNQNLLVAWWQRHDISSQLKIHEDSALVDKLKLQPGLVKNFVAIFNSSDSALRERLRDFFVRLFEHERSRDFLKDLAKDLEHYAVHGTPYERIGLIGVFGSAIHSNMFTVKNIGYAGLEVILNGGDSDLQKLVLNQLELKVAFDTNVPDSLVLSLRRVSSALDEGVSRAAMRVLSHIEN